MTDHHPRTAGPSVHCARFGTMPDGTPVDRYELSNGSGLVAGILTYGGILQSLSVPDRHGNPDDVVLGFDNLADYVARSPYFGALIGRFGNRLARGRFAIDDEWFQVPVNNGPNALHGGPAGFDTRLWEAAPFEDGERAGVSLGLCSPDGDMGFPGALRVTVRYSLDRDNRLIIDYHAETDRPTLVNLTNHAYFNLRGAGRGTVLDQVAMIDADRYTPVDDTLLPTGELAPVRETPMDFRTATPIGARIDRRDVQLRRAEAAAGGYDHNWVLNTAGQAERVAARVTDSVSGRCLECGTTEPGVQFYTGNFLDGTLVGKGGRAMEHWGGFTLEAQHYPDSPNQPGFPSTRLDPGEAYRQTTLFRFSAV